MSAPTGTGLISQNKRASFDWFLTDRVEAGVCLLGWEVKAIRESKAQMNGSHVIFKNEEAFLVGMSLAPSSHMSSHSEHDETRSRKLLLAKAEIKRMMGQCQVKGMSVIALNLHWKNGRVKCEIALAKGKKQHDKREATKERELDKSARQALLNKVKSKT